MARKKTAKQAAAQARFKAAAAQAKREGASGKRYAKRVGEILRGGGSRSIVRRGGGGSPAKSNPGTPGKMGLGSAYYNGKTMAQIGAPVTQAAILSVGTDRNLKTELQGRWNLLKAKPIDYGESVAVAVADRWLDKKTGQAAAMSRGSVTAILPEAIIALEAGSELRVGGIDTRTRLSNAHRAASVSNSGYDPQTGTTNLGDPRFVKYRVAKHGLQAARLIANRTAIGRRITAPLKKGLSVLGLRA